MGLKDHNGYKIQNHLLPQGLEKIGHVTIVTLRDSPEISPEPPRLSQGQGSSGVCCCWNTAPSLHLAVAQLPESSLWMFPDLTVQTVTICKSL